jgi:hypothetical protein
MPKGMAMAIVFPSSAAMHLHLPGHIPKSWKKFPKQRNRLVRALGVRMANLKSRENSNEEAFPLERMPLKISRKFNGLWGNFPLALRRI